MGIDLLQKREHYKDYITYVVSLSNERSTKFDDDKDCPICIENYKNNKTIFNCGHITCSTCVWDNVTHDLFLCPICRSFIC